MLEKKRYFLCLGAIIAILILGALVGLAVPLPQEAVPQQDFSHAPTLMQNVQGQHTFRLIFFNNTRVFLMLTLGILTGGLLSIGEAFVIGYMVGFLIQVGQGQNMAMTVMMASLLPHGIPEVGAFMSIGALGLYFASKVYGHVTKDRQVDWVGEAKLYGKFAAVAYGVIFLAALVETYISPNLVKRLMEGAGS
jgi:uncharacterized membrane protein SpoIIM required for sporulation